MDFLYIIGFLFNTLIGKSKYRQHVQIVLIYSVTITN